MILGLSFSHNAAACLVDETDGAAVFCCAEERFSRRKNDWGMPVRTLDYIFRQICRPESITCVVVGESCRNRYASEEYARLLNLVDYAAKDKYLRSKARLAWVVSKEMIARGLGRTVDLRQVVTEAVRALGVRAECAFIDHHEAHAAGAYYTGPFENALVVTLDGEGDGCSGSCWAGRGPQLTRLDTLPDYASIGLFYKAITSFLGFKVNQQEGKVTGLAAYGDPQRFQPSLRPLLYAVTENGKIEVVSKAAQRHMDRFSRRRVCFFRLLSRVPEFLRTADWETLLNRLLRKEFRQLFREALDFDLDLSSLDAAADLAAAAQQVTEETAIEVIRFYQGLAPSANLALAGGVFANVRLNQRISELPGIERTYVYPPMGDEGLALGAALAHWHAGRPRKSTQAVLRHVFLGPAYSDAAIWNALEKSGTRWERLADDDAVERVVAALVSDRVVGVSRGALEYGPRALGHRSILANPVSPDIKRRLNRRLGRSGFMPFAPTGLDTCFGSMFPYPPGDRARLAARFMTIALDVSPAWLGRIPGVTHVDGTSRPQVLGRDEEPFFYRVVERFHEATGVGCVLNTSFNMHDEPIINTPEEALHAAGQGAVDLLVIENYVVEGFPAAPTEAGDAEPAPHPLDAVWTRE
jgi:carbamoyltransferase